MNISQRRHWLKTALAGVAAVGLGRLPLRAQEASKKFSEDFGPDWQVQKDYTLEVAQAMPAENYAFKPAEGMRNFTALMGHIGQSTFAFAAGLRGEPTPPQASPPKELTKENIVAYLTAAFDYAAEGIAALTDAQAQEDVSIFGGRVTMPRGKVCHAMRDHISHHRGYALPYLRINGVTPPNYRFAGRRPSPV
ncbi:MAG: DinB family protein [Candidatus Acidiferrales bacterium]